MSNERLKEIYNDDEAETSYFLNPNNPADQVINEGGDIDKKIVDQSQEGRQSEVLKHHDNKHKYGDML